MTVETQPTLTDDAEPSEEPPAPNHVFVLRLWPARADEWWGRVQHISSGETRYFRAWSGLVAHLKSLLAEGPASDQERASGNEESTS